MATEIELKAHVKDHEAIKLLLSKKAEYFCAFEKEDSYWLRPENTGSLTRFRLRREKCILTNGTETFTCFIGYKKKEVNDGIEVNDEREFEIKPGIGAENFLRELGLEPVISKRKRGWAWSYEGILAELVEVDGLGWFIELEILKDEKTPCDISREESFKEEKKRLLDFISFLGIEKKAIESRYYTEMLNITALAPS